MCHAINTKEIPKTSGGERVNDDFPGKHVLLKARESYEGEIKDRNGKGSYLSCNSG